ncbi:hypothetical protein GCM10012275_64470 [Longimycelium tulufanense]|uniref:Uncharacterized protein n=1 Tax=Longimycelium tulufanense TaxID=907463 RepID=A0A8J3FY47_9PSEU|nr:hypothetical protein [Longimycelium tulufanense]GGM84830.1 hypothetical protein GCM10012275_64470 [Longimycelium tulufanense]
MDTSSTMHGYRNGERVRDTRDGATGTVRFLEWSDPDEARAEIVWDNSFVADELADHILPYLARV